MVYCHLLPHFRVSLVEALQPIPPGSLLNGTKSFLTIPGCHLISKYSQLILGKGEPSSGIDHYGFHQASFLFYFREEMKEGGCYINHQKRHYPLEMLPTWSRLKLPAWTYQPSAPLQCIFRLLSCPCDLHHACLSASHSMLCRGCQSSWRFCSLTASFWVEAPCSSPTG